MFYHYVKCKGVKGLILVASSQPITLNSMYKVLSGSFILQNYYTDEITYYDRETSMISKHAMPEYIISIP